MVERRTKDSRSGHARLVPRRDRPVAARPAPLPDPRQAPQRAPAPRQADPRATRAARTAGLVLAGAGLLWVLATWAGEAWGWSARGRVFFDLFALAGFGFGLYLTWQAWRIARADKG
ncbi:MAG TPA: DUF5337 domain-containing protein [Rubellimicrobium sp.]|nr:DUF5337 domain-containing protein [Rubellimicrobium sp.]